MLLRIRERVLIFHTDRQGQAIVFVALFCLVMALFALMVINIGFLTNNRIKAQSSADAVALSGAAWIARGLNFETMLNVTNAQILAWIIVIDAMMPANTAVQVIAAVEIAVGNALCAFPPACPAGQVLQSLGQIAQNVGLPILRPIQETLGQLTESKDSGLWQVMKTINKLQEFAKYAFPGMALFRSVTVARDNESDLGLIIPPYMPLPVKKGTFDEFCTGQSSDYNAWDRAMPHWLMKYQWIGSALYLVAVTAAGPAVYLAALHCIKALYCAWPSGYDEGQDQDIPDGLETECGRCEQLQEEGRIVQTQWEIYTYYSNQQSGTNLTGNQKSDKRNNCENATVTAETILDQCRNDVSCEPGSGEPPPCPSGCVCECLIADNPFNEPTPAGGADAPECPSECGCGSPGGFSIFSDPEDLSFFPPEGFSGNWDGTFTDCRGEHCYYIESECQESSEDVYNSSTEEYDEIWEIVKVTRVAFHTQCDYTRDAQQLMDETLEDTDVNIDDMGVEDSSSGSLPIAYVLDESDDDPVEDKLQFIGLSVVGLPGFGNTDKVQAFVGPNIFKNPNPLTDIAGVITYAQAEVYNGTSTDLWTMDWRVRLVPAKKILGGSDIADSAFVPLH